MSSDCGTIAAVTRTWSSNPRKVALTLNLKTAKTLEITFAEALQGVPMKLSTKSANVPYWHKREVPTLTTNVGPLSEADYSRDLQPRLGPAAGEERRHSPERLGA